MISKSVLLASLLALTACGGEESQETTGADEKAPAVAASGTAQTLEAACATCVYKMPGVKGCALAVQVEGKPMLVSGVPQPGHDSGLCEHAQQAEITGQVEGEKFVAASFHLKP